MPVGDISDDCSCEVCSGPVPMLVEGKRHTEAVCLYLKCQCCAAKHEEEGRKSRERIDAILHGERKWNDPW